MKASVWKMSLLIVAVAVVASGQAIQPNSSGMAATGATKVADTEVTTTRDAQGIWFIEGGDLYDVYEAMGYAVAQDRMWQMDLLRRQGRGKLAALLGPGLVSTDVFIRTIMYSEEEFAAAFDALSDDAKTATQAYVDGVNRRIGEFYAGDWLSMPYEYWILGLQSVLLGPGLPVLPEPFTVADALGWTAMFFRGFDPEALNMGQLDNGILVQTLLAAYGDPDPNVALAMFADLRWINDPSAQTMIPGGAKSTATPQLPTVDISSYPDLRPAANIRSRVEAYQQQMKELNIQAKFGSYAWAISGDKTASGNPILYTGPQMGFSTPSICTEGSVRGGGIEVSGMHIPGIPGIMLGRTPNRTWSAQVGHGHTVDYYLEAPQSVSLHRMETIKVFGGEDITIPVFRSSHGPIVEPIPYDPGNPPELIVSWAYGNWGHEADFMEVFLEFAQGDSIEDMNAAAEKAGVSMHSTYVDTEGNIAYWMTGWDPIRAPGVDPRLPSIADGTTEWTGERRPLAHDVNTAQGYYGGWNNKASVDYNNATNNTNTYYGKAQRAHVIEEYLSTHDDLSFEDVRDLALSIATTDGFPVGTGWAGGNNWAYVADAFAAAVAADPTADRQAAVDMLNAWDGHFVAGGPSEWPMGTQRADAWVLQDAWISEVMRLTFEDEFMMAGMDYADQLTTISFNVLVRMLEGAGAAMPALYPWFLDVSDSGKPQTLPELIVLGLDNVLAGMGLGPYGAPRGMIVFNHQVFGDMWSIPFSNRSTFAQCIEFDENGPARIESMFPLGESGELLPDAYGQLSINPHFFSMTPVYDPFMPRPFPLFD